MRFLSFTTCLMATSALVLTACAGHGGQKSSSSKTLSLASSPSLAPVIQYGASDGFGGAGVHTILAGDTLYSIAKQYKLNVRDIIDANAVQPPYHLAVGSRLKLPPPGVYTVKMGDSLPILARTFSVSQYDLASMNNISAPFRLNVGQELRVPRAAIAVAAAPQSQSDFAPALSSSISPVTAPAGDGSVIASAIAPIGPSTTPPSSQTPGILGTLTRAAPQQPTTLGTVPAPQLVAQVETPGGFLAPPPVKPVAEPAVAHMAPDDIPSRASSRFLKPVGGTLLSNYGAKSGGLYNEGINIAAPRGTPVRVAENGRVVYVGNAVEGYGNLILVKHADGFITAYAHLEKPLTKEGQDVKRGQVIGTVGSTGNVNRAQLHFEIRQGRKSIDPLTQI